MKEARAVRKRGFTHTVEIRGVTDRVKGFRFSPVGSGGEMRWVQLAE